MRSHSIWAGLLLVACGSGHDLELRVQITDVLARAAADRVVIELAPGRCEERAEPIYHAEVTRDGEASLPPALSPGTYALRAEALSERCGAIAIGCVEIEAPDDERVVVELVTISGALARCASSDGGDAGPRPDAMPDARFDADAIDRSDADAGTDATDSDATPDADAIVDADATLDGDAMLDADASPSAIVYDLPGVYALVVPPGATVGSVVVEGGSGGGADGSSFGSDIGGRAARVTAVLTVAPGAVLRIVVGEGGHGAACGGGTTGGGGGGISGVFDEAFDAPIAIAAGGGGASIYAPGCAADSMCATLAFGTVAGNGFGGGGRRSDLTATDGRAGSGPTAMTAWAGGAAGAGNCGALEGVGGFGGGGGGGGTRSGFGGGGGGAGWPGGRGGGPGLAGVGGTSFLDVMVEGLIGSGSAGGTAGADGASGRVTISFE